MPIAVRPSTIEGQGVFATADIPASARVLEYLGRRISKAESLRQTAAGNPFIVALDDQTDLDGAIPENQARFANHSCEPNCELLPGDGCLWLGSLRLISAGEELTFDYGYDLVDFRDHPCRCGAERCVGFIVAGPFHESIRRLMASLGQWPTAKA
jgi:SET domain-containing protein